MLNEQGEIYSKNEFIKTGFPHFRQANCFRVIRSKTKINSKDKKRQQKKWVYMWFHCIKFSAYVPVPLNAMSCLHKHAEQ